MYDNDTQIHLGGGVLSLVSAMAVSSELSGNACKDSVHTVVISVMH